MIGIERIVAGLAGCILGVVLIYIKPKIGIHCIFLILWMANAFMGGIFIMSFISYAPCLAVNKFSSFLIVSMLADSTISQIIMVILGILATISICKVNSDDKGPEESASSKRRSSQPHHRSH